LLAVVGDAAARSAHREARPEDERETDLLDGSLGLLERASDHGPRALETDLLHRGLEELALLALADGLDLGPDELDAVLLERAPRVEGEREVERRLPSEGGQNGVRALLLDDRLEHLGHERLDVG